jgi:hypothetical protein
MDYTKSIRAALRAKAPVVAVPVEGHAPVCVKASLLKGALKGVTIDSVEMLENHWLKITGTAKGGVHTCTKFSPMTRYNALRMISDWAERERKKRVKVINQGVLSAAEQRAMKLKAAEQAGVEALIEAQKEQAEIIAEAKASVFPVITPVKDEDRAEIVAEYSQFHKYRRNRKRGSVIRWRLAKLREQVKGMTKTKNVYGDKPYTVSPLARRRRNFKGTVTELRKKKDKLKYAGLLYQIGQLEKQYESLYPPIQRANGSDPENVMYWDSWITKRSIRQTYTVPWNWHDGCKTMEVVEEGYDCDREDDYRSHVKNVPAITRLAARLKECRANIRALTPPADEYTQEQIAA